MLGYLKRLVTTGAAYQFGDIVAKGIALLTLPLYTRHSSPRPATAPPNSLLTAVILCSIFAARRRRRGVHPLLLRRRGHRAARADRAHGDRDGRLDDDARLARSRSSFAGAALAACCSATDDPLLIDCAMLGLWAFTNLEMAYAQLRVDERTRTYVYASGANVAMTVVFTVIAGRVRRAGRARPAARQLRRLRGRRARAVVGAAPARRRCACASPTCARCCASACRRSPPTPASTRCRSPTASTCSATYSHAAAGEYAIAMQLATVVFVAVRGFQYAWPPLAYSIESDAEAARLYSLVTTYFVLATGVVVVRRRAARALDGAAARRARSTSARYRALPWLALGWTLYGLYLVFDRDLRPRARHLAQPARGAAGLRGQRRRCCSCSCRTAAPGWGSPAPASRCAAPTWRCCSSCTC